MNTCLVCKKNIKNKLHLCSLCSKDPFKVESLRTFFSEKKDFLNLEKTYSIKYPEIKNTNTSHFWDIRLGKKTELKYQDGMTRNRVKTVFNFIPPSAKKILDVGAGYGFIEEMLSKRDAQIVGIDISPIAISNLRKKFSGTFHIKSLYNYQYPKNFFDVVLALEVLEHVPPSKTLKLLKKIKNSLKKGQYFILSVPLNEGLEKMKNNPNGHVRTYSKSLIFGELKISGFKILKAKYLFAFKNFYWIKTIFSKVFKNRWQPNNLIVIARAI